MIQISAVIMARNEEENIVDAITSLSFASQVVVADTGSSDNTMELARKAGAEVHSIYFDGYGSSKNRALEFARHDWILSLDADERVSPELAQNIIKALANSPHYDGYAIPRLAYFLGKPIRHGGWYPDYVVRLFRNGKGRFSERLVHESIELEGRPGKLDGLIYHYSYKDLHSYLEKMNIYSSLSARELHGRSKTGHVWDMIIHPLAIFMKMYFFKAGFLDGFHGLLLAVLSSFHVLIKYAKLWELGRRGAAR